MECVLLWRRWLVLCGVLFFYSVILNSCVPLQVIVLCNACELEPQCKTFDNCPSPKTENRELFKTVCIDDGTERAWTGKYEKENIEGNGVFYCACCDNPLFPASTFYDSGMGWPSFYNPYNESSVSYAEDTSCALCGKRVEVSCHKCGIHLGHVFGDGPPPTNLRYCMNSVCLNYGPAPDNITHSLPKDYSSRIPKFPSPVNALYWVIGFLIACALGVIACVLAPRITTVFEETVTPLNNSNNTPNAIPTASPPTELDIKASEVQSLIVEQQDEDSQ